jgi:hypothetical protein
MPSGPEYVEATLAKVERTTTAIGALAGVDESWRAEAQTRLVAVAELLRGTTGRFFLKTRVCLPFARKCDQAACKLEAALETLAGEGSEQPPLAAALEAALAALEKAARTLDERSMMQGMSIT